MVWLYNPEMKNKTSASIFSGGALFDVGAQNAGYEIIWGIEKDDKIASVARLNGFPVMTADVNDVDFSTLQRPNHLHASPPCPNFSNANNNAQETETDIAMAESVCRALLSLNPDTFTLENVMNYRNGQSFKRITETLNKMGYWWDATNLNSADFGVPQTRVRLWIRASRGMLVGYPAPVKWVGWYEAIQDMIQELPDAEFAPWQIARLPEEYKSFLIGQGTYSAPLEKDVPAHTVTSDGGGRVPKGFVLNGGNKNANTFTPRDEDQPITTITASMDKTPSRAVVLDGQSNEGDRITVRNEDEPIFTQSVESANRTGNAPRAFIFSAAGNTNISEAYPGKGVRYEEDPAHTVTSDGGGRVPKGFILDGQSNEGDRITVRNEDEPIFTQSASASRRPARAYVGRVVKMNVHCLGRFQTVPDWYQGLTVKINGNGVPCLLAQRVLETLS